MSWLTHEIFGGYLSGLLHCVRNDEVYELKKRDMKRLRKDMMEGCDDCNWHARFYKDGSVFVETADGLRVHIEAGEALAFRGGVMLGRTKVRGWNKERLGEWIKGF